MYEDTISEMGIAQTIIRATDGVAASQKFRNQEFDVVITDLEMPKKSGDSFLQDIIMLLKFPPERIVILSGHLDSAKVKAALKLGVKNILTKPFTADKLVDVINKINFDAGKK